MNFITFKTGTKRYSGTAENGRRSSIAVLKEELTPKCLPHLAGQVSSYEFSSSLNPPPQKTNKQTTNMRFTFAAATLLGCLLSTGICVANPISARRDLSSSSGEIVARSPTELITPVRRVDTAKVDWLERPEEGFNVKDEIKQKAISSEKYISDAVAQAQRDRAIPSGPVEYFKKVDLKPHEKVDVLEAKSTNKEYVIYFTYTGAKKLWGYVSLAAAPLYGRVVLFDSEEIVFPKLTGEKGEAALQLTKKLAQQFSLIKN
ncbi:hypothetical protein BDP27DRAFT_1418701 [Rhodocollybia butyracea]|uniref:Uncharacterized protein n=1 Tax=Rhodocollybia butyracea TaxID=206335 RepID=A0A9P5Q1I4_9AGAR|nr:hypothetical protein BDP27DRAFT_1418701 [Rhodocollybia butyracea]